MPDIKFKAKDLEKLLNGLDPKTARFAMAVALTRTAQVAKEDLKGEIKGVFKNPTAFTLNSPFMRGAKKSDLTAIVGIKDKAEYLVAQIKGGARPRTRTEKRMLPVIAPRRYMAAKGKVSRGERTKMLSAFKVLEMGNRNESSKRGKAKAKKQEQYVAKKLPKNKGIHVYKMQGKGKLKLMFWSIKQPHYRKRLDVQGVVRDAMDVQLMRKFKAAYEEAIARPKP